MGGASPYLDAPPQHTVPVATCLYCELILSQWFPDADFLFRKPVPHFLPSPWPPVLFLLSLMVFSNAAIFLVLTSPLTRAEGCSISLA